MSTDKDWERWGKDNPYYGVLSHDKYLGKKLPKTIQQDFYKSGVADIAHIFKNLEKIDGPVGKFKLAVDYGCGVGRLTLPLKNYSRHVIGLDISPSMIETARKMSKNKDKNVQFEVVDASLRNLPKNFDYFNSHIVFQHIPPKQGMIILDKLFENLDNKGYFSLQLTFGYDRSFWGKTMLFMRERVTIARYIANILKGKNFNTPNMKMHSYDLNEINELLYRHKIREYRTSLTNHGGYWGVFLFGKKV